MCAFVFSKVQSSDISSSVNPVRLHCQQVGSSQSTKSAHKVPWPFRCDPDTTDDLRGCKLSSSTHPSSNSPASHSPAALCQVSMRQFEKKKKEFSDQ